MLSCCCHVHEATVAWLLGQMSSGDIRASDLTSETRHEHFIPLTRSTAFVRMPFQHISLSKVHFTVCAVAIGQIVR